MIRHNFLTNDGAAQQYVEGVLALKDPSRFPWPNNPDLSIYDFFVFWHARTMMTLTPPEQSDRNAAHSGPAFLPWHRYMLLRFEEYLRAAVEDDAFRLPYWDWNADAERTVPRRSPVWGTNRLGRFMRSDFVVRVGMNASGRIVRANRRLQRTLGAEGELPIREDVRAIVEEQAEYDAEPFDSDSPGFRNNLEGWIGPNVHNLVHVWVGGDMQFSTSPNDPAFYLHHCNVDRIWSAWQARWPEVPYVPPADAPEALLFHRAGDALYTFFDEQVTPADMWSHTERYEYDRLDDLIG
jgi:tyrosinase